MEDNNTNTNIVKKITPPPSSANSANEGEASEANDSTNEQTINQTTKNPANEGNEKKEITRSQIAQIYVKAFFAVIFVVIFVCCLPIAQNRFETFQDVLITVSGILSGPLGFIIGYYFKSGDNQQ